MLLVIDVGNSQTVFGLYDGSRLCHHWRLQTNRERTADEYGVLVGHLLRGVAGLQISGVTVSSVVPPLSTVIEDWCRRYLGRKPLLVGPGVRTGMPILYDHPAELGSDRLVNAVAAYERTRAATIVVDFGTATKVDYVSAKGEYVGGVIAPGLGIASDALVERAARLYRVELVKPPQVVGRNTAHAIQSGLIYGFVALVDGLIARLQRETHTRARAIATGGFASLLGPESERIDEVDEFLTLDGLRLIYERNSGH